VIPADGWSNVLGFDPGYGETGWALLRWRAGGPAAGVLAAGGSLKTPPRDVKGLGATAAQERRLADLVSALTAQFGGMRVDVVAVEHYQPYSGPGAPPGRAAAGTKTAWTEGALLGFWAARGTPVRLVAAASGWAALRATGLVDEAKHGDRAAKVATGSSDRKDEAVAQCTQFWPLLAEFPRSRRSHVLDAALAALYAATRPAVG
jgi:Holliday junction resolvasome RuvABC endonuclease subunit